jgi:hypothetical protein
MCGHDLTRCLIKERLQRVVQHFEMGRAMDFYYLAGEVEK